MVLFFSQKRFKFLFLCSVLFKIFMKILGFGERHLSEKLFREVKVDPEYYRRAGHINSLYEN